MSTPQNWNSLKKDIPNINIVQTSPNILANKMESKIDILLLSNDVSFDNSFSFFSFAVKHGLLVDSSLNPNPEKLLKEFTDKRRTDEQVQYINKLHYESLVNAKIVPILAAPYTTGCAPNFNGVVSKYTSRTLVWNFKKN